MISETTTIINIFLHVDIFSFLIIKNFQSGFFISTYESTFIINAVPTFRHCGIRGGNVAVFKCNVISKNVGICKKTFFYLVN